MAPNVKNIDFIFINFDQKWAFSIFEDLPI